MINYDRCMFCFFSKGSIYFYNIYIYKYTYIYIYMYTVNLHRPCPDPYMSALAQAPKHDCPQGPLEWSKTKFGSGALLRACCHRPSHRRCCWLGYCLFGWEAGLLLALGVILELKSLLVAAGALHLRGPLCGSLAAAVALLMPCSYFLSYLDKNHLDEPGGVYCLRTKPTARMAAPPAPSGLLPPRGCAVAAVVIATIVEVTISFWKVAPVIRPSRIDAAVVVTLFGFSSATFMTSSSMSKRSDSSSIGSVGKVLVLTG